MGCSKRATLKFSFLTALSLSSWRTKDSYWAVSSSPAAGHSARPNWKTIIKILNGPLFIWLLNYITTDLAQNLVVFLVVVEEEFGLEHVVHLALRDLLLSQAFQLSVLVKGQLPLSTKMTFSLLKFGLCRVFLKIHFIFN